ncbi:DUF6527 family protein [Sphingomonas abietis]|uniref:DUF6527 family protein n=1 Tax=Sphingomonas abietis TaxID=3012344 RepID=UPI00389AAE42
MMFEWLTATSTGLWRSARKSLARRLRSRVKVTAVDERPTMIRKNRLYVTVRSGKAGFGFMVCPCGCGETLHLRFFGDRHPRWSIGALKGNATVHPSVWRTTGCRSHFVLTDGQINWCE